MLFKIPDIKIQIIIIFSTVKSLNTNKRLKILPHHVISEP